MVRRAFAEFIGTYALVFVGTSAIVINDLYGGSIGHLGISIAFGTIVMAMIYSIGDKSGAHINPAVTIAFWVAKRFKKEELLPYISAQLIGAIIASATVYSLFPDHNELGETLPADTWHRAFIMEFILTFFLMYVILNVSHGSKEKGIMAGAAIGATVCLEALIGGPVSGASMNPARSIAPALFSGNIEHLWIYIVSPPLGALAAVYSCKIIQPDQCCEGNC